MGFLSNIQRLISALLLCATLLLGTSLLMSLSGSAGHLPEKLSGSSGDLIRVRPNTKPTADRIVMRDTILSGRDSVGLGRRTPGLVTLCLQNVSAGTKAFDNRQKSKPRYSVPDGVAMCGRFEPIRHDFSFYRKSEDEKFVPVIKTPLDLSAFQDKVITLNW